jgi:hypothetical protein
MSDRDKIITARDIFEALSGSKVVPRAIAGATALRKIKKKKELDLLSKNDGTDFVPSEVPDKIDLADDKTQSHEVETKEIWNYHFDPYLGDCSWYEVIEGKESKCLLTLTEVDNWMFGFTQQTYTPPPGIRLIITKGIKSRPENRRDNKIKFGHRFNQADVRVYVHRRSFRVEFSKQYQEFGTLADRAQTGGLSEIGFPVDWDAIPYDI